MTCSVIISAYNNFSTLEKVLWGYEVQTRSDFDVIIADDGSNARFSDQLSDFSARTSLRMHHVWHPDDGFRKCVILNKAICAARADYLLFSDADIVPRNDFVENHQRLARQGRFVSGSGGHVNIPSAVHATLTEEEIKQQSIFDPQWLARHQMASFRNVTRLTFRGGVARLGDLLTPRRNAFVGCNAAAFREDLLAVNGFDETFIYGGLDRDLGVRLANHGVRGIQCKYSLCCVHLGHPRPYRDEEVVRSQKALFRDRIRRRTVLPVHGISEAARTCSP